MHLVRRNRAGHRHAGTTTSGPRPVEGLSDLAESRVPDPGALARPALFRHRGRAVRPGRALLDGDPLPFGLELYRVAVALVLLVWMASLLVDPSVRLRHTPLDAPVALIVAASLGSVAVNFGRVAPLASAVLKGVTLFLSFIIFFYFISSVVTSVASVVVVTKFLVSGVAVVAFFAIVEQRTGFNVFDHLRSVFPFLQFEGSITSVRFGLIRAVGSADHPIALGVLFAMSVPLGVALARSLSRVWWLPTLLILIGVMATASRTPILAIVTQPRSPSCGFGPVTSFLSCLLPSRW